MESKKKAVLPMNIQFFANQEPSQNHEPVQEDQKLTEEQLQKVIEENKRYKDAMDKLTKEAAENRRRLRDKMTESEKLNDERIQHVKEREEELQELRRKVEVNEHTEALIELGYSRSQARKAAEAQSNGDFDTYIKIQKDIIESKVKSVTSKTLKDMPTATTGERLGSITKEQFEQMGYAQRVKLLNEEPETYRRLNSYSRNDPFLIGFGD